MKTRRNLVVFAIVASALFADRSVASQLNRHEPAAPESRTFARKLSANYRNALKVISLFRSESTDTVIADVSRTIEPISLDVAQIAHTPFQFRLPPPVV